jgi:hypothetical protein
VLPTFSLGVEYNPLADDVRPLVNWIALKEKEKRPALMFGTSSDRIGTPRGQAYFATLSKNLKDLTGVPIAPYAGVSYGTFDDRLRAIGGLWAGFGKGFSTTVIWDGEDLHPTVSYQAGQHVFTLLWVDLENVGLAYSLAF